MNLKLPISTAQMIFKRCWETGGGESQQLLLPEEQQKSCHALQNKGLGSYFGKIGFGLWTLCEQKRFMIAASRHGKIWDLRDKPLFRFFLLMPVCRPKAADLSASQLRRARLPQRPLLRTCVSLT